MTLLFLTLALLGPYALLTAVGRVLPRARLAPRTRAKVGVSLLFLVTASGHFTQTAAMAQMLPPWVPSRVGIIYVTGVLELLGAIGIWVPGMAKPTGLCLILMLVGVFPSNVYAALNRVPFGGHESGPVYLLVRLPFQVMLIAWIYKATGQRWLQRATSAAGSGSRHEGETGSRRRRGPEA